MKLMNVTEPEAVFRLITDNFPALEKEEVGIEEAGGRYLAEDFFQERICPALTVQRWMDMH